MIQLISIPSALIVMTIAAVGETITLDQIVETGVKLGNLSVAAVWATVAVVCVLVIKKLSADKDEITKNALECITKNNEKTDSQIKLLQEMHNDISLCRKLNLEKLEKAKVEDRRRTFDNP